MDSSMFLKFFQAALIFGWANASDVCDAEMDNLQKSENLDAAFDCDYKHKYHDMMRQYLHDGDKAAAVSVTKRSLKECGKISEDCAAEVAPELTVVAEEEWKNDSAKQSLIALLPSLVSKKVKAKVTLSKTMQLVMSTRRARQERQARLSALEAHEQEEEYGNPHYHHSRIHA
eukprot:gnl/MRDRNA2_/MRDRNA2_89364_c0_seq1.p1 gnl/MRDRNA2_/MRDRNA2_89364_c0~~gnl/MRDRNA2_/MRDRNA2_89364_c0_seq1.p1  ORF type:complete len:173 (-),score=48.07 gnl/MRDRNA2_/MRDRNA2_89364_c0_seq1:89-607(-)